MKPKYDLAHVRRLAEEELEGGVECIEFLAPPKSIWAVVSALQYKGFNFSFEKAREWICYRLIDLTPEDFCQQKAGQWDEPTWIVDHYGRVFEGIPWFIKFSISKDGFLEEISFHPMKEDMRLANGNKIAKWSLS